MSVDFILVTGFPLVSLVTFNALSKFDTVGLLPGPAILTMFSYRSASPRSACTFNLANKFSVASLDLLPAI